MNFDKQPEVHVAIFGFMTSFIWEFLQMPFFDVGQATYWERTLGCTQASFGDAGILLVAYSLVSLLKRNRYWMFEDLDVGGLFGNGSDNHASHRNIRDEGAARLGLGLAL